MSASGCSRDGAAEVPDSRRAQLVLDLVGIDLRLTLRGFAERDDTDFMLALRVDDGYRNTSEKPEGDEALLAVGEPIVFKGEGKALEYVRRVEEIEPMGFQVRGAFGL